MDRDDPAKRLPPPGGDGDDAGVPAAPMVPFDRPAGLAPIGGRADLAVPGVQVEAPIIIQGERPQAAEDPEAVVDGVENSVDAKFRGSYYDMVPPQYKGVIDGLVDSNYKAYMADFTMGEFREAMAKNWLMKRDTMAEFARQFGLAEVAEPGFRPEQRAEVDKAGLAMLTLNASLLTASPGSMSETGASVTYQRLPLREGDGTSLKDMQRAGVIFGNLPQHGQRLTLDDASTKGQLFTTSPMLSIFQKEGGADPSVAARSVRDFGQSVGVGFRSINARTVNK